LGRGSSSSRSRVRRSARHFRAWPPATPSTRPAGCAPTASSGWSTWPPPATSSPEPDTSAPPPAAPARTGDAQSATATLSVTSSLGLGCRLRLGDLEELVGNLVEGARQPNPSLE